MDHLILVFVFFFGAIFGSFAGVLVYRLPRGKSIVTSSRCDHCETPIPWYMNFPIFGFLLLRGKCKFCGAKINLKNFGIEVLCALIAVLLFPEYLTEQTLLTFLFKFTVSICLVVHFFVDIEYRILPDQINLFLAAVFFLYSVFNNPWTFWASGFGVGFGFTYLITWIFYKIRGQIGLGGGDIKLYGALGLYLGPYGIVMNIFLSCFLGALIGVLLIAFKVIDRSTPIAFGPYIIIAACFQVFFPDSFSTMTSFLFQR